MTLSLPVKVVNNKIHGSAELCSKPKENREIRKLSEYLLSEPPYKIKSTLTRDSHEKNSIFSLVSSDSCVVPPIVHLWIKFLL